MVTVYKSPSLPPSLRPSQPFQTQLSETPPSSQVVFQPPSPSPSSRPTKDLFIKESPLANTTDISIKGSPLANPTKELSPEGSPLKVSPLTLTTSTLPPNNHYSFLSPGPDAELRSTQLSRDQTYKRPLPLIEKIALPKVRNRVGQCQHCGQLGHSKFLCPQRDSPSVAENYNDWRLVCFKSFGRTYVYSVLALHPTLAQPKIRHPKKPTEPKKPTDALPIGSVSNINPVVSSRPSTSSQTNITVPSSSSSGPSQEQSDPSHSTSSMVRCCTCHECTCGCHTK